MKNKLQGALVGLFLASCHGPTLERTQGKAGQYGFLRSADLPCSLGVIIMFCYGFVKVTIEGVYYAGYRDT